MRKDTRGAKITKVEIRRNNKIAKKRYIVEQYFGLSHLYHEAYRARFTVMMKNIWDAMCRQMAFNLFRGSRLIVETQERVTPEVWASGTRRAQGATLASGQDQ